MNPVSTLRELAKREFTEDEFYRFDERAGIKSEDPALKKCFELQAFKEIAAERRVNKKQNTTE